MHRSVPEKTGPVWMTAQEHEYWLPEHMDYCEDIGYCGEAGDNIRDMKALLNRYGLSWTKES